MFSEWTALENDTVILVELVTVWPFLIQDTFGSGTPFDAVQLSVAVSPSSSDSLSTMTNRSDGAGI